MQIYFDSSAFAKRYIAEPGSKVVFKYLQRASEVILSCLTFPEVIAAFNRLLRERHIDPEQYLNLKSVLLRDLEQATLLEISAAILKQAVLCLEKTPLRTIDALHVATALHTRCNLFISADQRQCRAARNLGLKVRQVA